ncbi:MAG: holo-ACP synthase [Clostridia bacterium]|nr:holo-ACP synthase [Clostridia bacterium]
MKVLCGVDIIEVERIQESIENLGEAFLNKVYTKNEIVYCESKKMQKYQSYAARFAAKEAVFKALSKEINGRYDITWKNIEILNEQTGRPKVNLIGLDKKIASIDISLSHIKETAIASVIITI